MAITNGYTTLTALKAEIGASDAANDPRLEAAITAASRQIDAYTGRRFWQDTTVQTREFYPDDAYCLTMPGKSDISTDTGLIVKVDPGDDGTYETTLTITTDYILLPANAADDGWPYTEIAVMANATAYFPTGNRRPSVQVTAKFGWAAVPAEVAQACLVQAKNLYKATSGTFSGFQLSVDAGVVMRVPGIDVVTAALLEPFVKARC